MSILGGRRLPRVCSWVASRLPGVGTGPRRGRLLGLVSTLNIHFPSRGSVYLLGTCRRHR